MAGEITAIVATLVIATRHPPVITEARGAPALHGVTAMVATEVTTGEVPVVATDTAVAEGMAEVVVARQ
jgi:hypothetical protein